MITEALKFLSDMHTASLVPLDVKVDGVRSKSIVAIGGELKEYPHQPPYRNHICHSVESFGEWCGVDLSTIWYGMNALTLILIDDDDSLRRDLVSMPLTRSSEWEAAMQGVANADQPKFIRWVLDHLDRNIEAASPGLLQTVRQLKFSVSEAGTGNVVNGKESFGKAIEAEVAGGIEFPDDITVSVLVWSELDIKVDVRMAFIVNPHDATFTLRALPASKQLTTQSALGQLGELLEEHKGESKLYCGCP